MEAKVSLTASHECSPYLDLKLIDIAIDLEAHAPGAMQLK